MVSHHKERVRHPLGLSGVTAVDACRNYNHCLVFLVSSSLNSVSSLSMHNFKLLESCKKVSERNVVRVLRNVKSLITVMDVFTTCSSLIINKTECMPNLLTEFFFWRMKHIKGSV